MDNKIVRGIKRRRAQQSQVRPALPTTNTRRGTFELIKSSRAGITGEISVLGKDYFLIVILLMWTSAEEAQKVGDRERAAQQNNPIGNTCNSLSLEYIFGEYGGIRFITRILEFVQIWGTS